MKRLNVVLKKIIPVLVSIILLTTTVFCLSAVADSNLFQGDLIQGTFSPESGSLLDSFTRVRSSSYINLSEGRYCLTTSGDFRFVVYVYSLEGTFIKGESFTNWSSSNTFIFKILGDRKILFGISYSDSSSIVPSDVPYVDLLRLDQSYKTIDLDHVTLASLSYDQLIETNNIISHDSLSLWRSPDFSTTLFNFGGGASVLRADFVASYSDPIDVGSYDIVLPFCFVINSYLTNTITDLGSVNYSVIFNDGLSYSGVTSFHKSSDFYISNLAFSLNVSSVSNGLFNNFYILFHFNNVTGDQQAAIYWVGFNSDPSITYANSYPSFDSSEIDSIQGEEAEIIDRFASDAEGALDSLILSSEDLLSNYQQSLFAFKRIADIFFAKNWVVSILSAAIVIGVLPFLARVVIRRGK